jgi:uncharacterized protein
VPEDGESPEGRLALARAALAALEASRHRIDDLNVYPVPDGDTGTNMAETVRAAVAALERDPSADVSRAVLMGARGNSGVILSQIVRGALEALPPGRVDSVAIAAALRGGADTAYASIRDPQEGTILTVARALAEGAEELAAAQAPLEEALPHLVTHGEQALARTREQLDVLRDAGVVDAGAAGLVEIARGLAAHVLGEPLPEPAHADAPLPLEAIHREPSRFRYCTTFFVEGDLVDPGALESELEPLGDCLLVVGAPGAVKAHLHTDEPGTVLTLATAVGMLEEIEIMNMHVQTAERVDRLARAGDITAVVAVCVGAGNRRLFESMGAICVDGGRTMNPAAAELVEAIRSARGEEVVVLPNNENVVPAVEQAAAAAAKPARVIPTHTLQAGLGALVAFDPTRPAEQNAAEMEDAASGVRAGAVTKASRSAVLGGLAVEQGQFLGLIAGEPVAAGPTLGPVAREVVERLVGNAADVLTVLVGEDGEGIDDLVRDVRSAHPELEIEVHDGGQPHYPLLFSVE